MGAEELRAVIQDAISESAGLTYFHGFLIILSAIAAGVAGYIGSYLKEKGKSTATREDIAEITRKIEEVKREFGEHDRSAANKYSIKHQACMAMLGILDAHLSHTMDKDNSGNPLPTDRQYATPAEVRRCHNEILLTVDNQEVIEHFLDIMFNRSGNPMDALDELRRLVRAELGFGSEFRDDDQATWIAKIGCAPIGDEEPS